MVLSVLRASEGMEGLLQTTGYLNRRSCCGLKGIANLVQSTTKISRAIIGNHVNSGGEALGTHSHV
jgi:hypothetical protein